MHTKILVGQVSWTSTPQPSYYGPIVPPVPSIGVMATEQFQYRDQVLPAVTQTAPVTGIAATWYGSAGAGYGSYLLGYGNKHGVFFTATTLFYTPGPHYPFDDASGTVSQSLS